MTDNIVHRFRMALSARMDQNITPEVAAAIEVEVFCGPDRSVSPARFPAIEHREYRIQVESLRAILEELAPLHAEHWLETEKHRHGLVLRPNYEAMMARERAGQLVQFTIRRGTELAGHLRMYLGDSLHTQTLVAEEDTLFLRPPHRPNGHLMIATLRYAETVLRALGVQEIRANSKLVNNADVLMRRMRYQPVALQFVKMLTDPPSGIAPASAASGAPMSSKEPSHEPAA